MREKFNTMKNILEIKRETGLGIRDLLGIRWNLYNFEYKKLQNMTTWEFADFLRRNDLRFRDHDIED